MITGPASKIYEIRDILAFHTGGRGGGYGSMSACVSATLRSGTSFVGVWPHLGQIERVVPVGVGLFERHDLHFSVQLGYLPPLIELTRSRWW